MPRVAIVNAVLLDVHTGDRHPDSVVVIDGDRIVDVTRGGAGPRQAELIDARGHTLMPGLIDAHAHPVLWSMNVEELVHEPLTLTAQHARASLEAMARRGFTTIRDAGGADDGLARAVAGGLIRGPRLFVSGRMLTQTGGHGDLRPREMQRAADPGAYLTYGFSHIADGVDAVRRATREELRRGATQIKLMASGGVASPSDPLESVQYSPAEIAAIAEEATSWGTYAMAHAYTATAVQRAAQAGVRSIEHGNLIDRDTATLLAERNAFIVPTLVTYAKLAELGPSLGLPEHSRRKLGGLMDAGLESLRIAAKAGVEIGFGTDLLGETQRYQNDELAIRAHVLSSLDVIRSATVVNAKLLRRVGELGVITPGASADLLLVEGDPLDDIGVLTGQGEHIDLVMRGGEVLFARV